MGYFLYELFVFSSLLLMNMEANQIYFDSISDDMEIAPDFFDYFEATAKILDKDKYAFKNHGMLGFFPITSMYLSKLYVLCSQVSIICCRSILAVSSWNDNGQKQFVHDPRKFV